MMWGFDYGYPMMGYSGYGFGWLHLAFSIFWILLLVALALVLIRWIRDEKPPHARHGNAALDILRERYARGEISREEFEEKKKDLAV